eukprot:c19116_g1_i4.p1 GENE.c19116_g1_i4~~c19116_g1_i4.p1  ORF type:complete len:522 (-),score=92.33 c19116_g1_i4:49-1545(-)
MERPAKKAKIAALALRELFADDARTETVPFAHVVLKNVLNQGFLNELRTQLVEIDFVTDSTDVHERFCAALDDCELGNVKRLRDALFGDDMRKAVSKLTGITVTSTPDLVAVVYRKGGYQACHNPGPLIGMDDEEEDGDQEFQHRRIWFELCLVPDDWAEDDGGHISLRSLEPGSSVPSNAVAVLAQCNSLVLFPVGPSTYVQVSEVSSTHKPRLSICGWYHTEAESQSLVSHPAPSDPNLLLPQSFGAEDTSDEDALAELKLWVNPDHLSESAIEALHEEFIKGSTLEVAAFLRQDKFDEIGRAIQELPSSSWGSKGPLHIRDYLTLVSLSPSSSHSKATEVVAGLSKFLQGAAVRWFLGRICNLSFTSECFETRKFSYGHYTLNVPSPLIALNLLEATLCLAGLPMPDEDSGQGEMQGGGFVTYLDGAEELLTVPPRRNALAIVFRDAGTGQYVKYLSSDSEDERQRLDMVLLLGTSEAPSDGEENDDNEDLGDDE